MATAAECDADERIVLSFWWPTSCISNLLQLLSFFFAISANLYFFAHLLLSASVWLRDVQHQRSFHWAQRRELETARGNISCSLTTAACLWHLRLDLFSSLSPLSPSLCSLQQGFHLSACTCSYMMSPSYWKLGLLFFCGLFAKPASSSIKSNK